MNPQETIQTIYIAKEKKRHVFSMHIRFLEDLDKIQKIIQSFSYIGKCKPLASHYKDYYGLYNNIVIHIIIISKITEIPLLEIVYVNNDENKKDVDHILHEFSDLLI